MKNGGTMLFPAGLLLTLGLGWFAFPKVLYRTTPQPIQFSHRVHTGEKGGMRCEDCHALREDGTFTGIPALEKCAGCHASPIGSSAEEKRLVDEYISRNREVPWQVYARQPENVYFSHAPHLKWARLSCDQCHGPQGASDTLPPYQQDRISGYSRDVRDSPRARKMAACEDCHDRHGMSGQGCLACHK